MVPIKYEITVAQAAPCMPHREYKNIIGSSTVLIMAPREHTYVFVRLRLWDVRMHAKYYSGIPKYKAAKNSSRDNNHHIFAMYCSVSVQTIRISINIIDRRMAVPAATLSRTCWRKAFFFFFQLIFAVTSVMEMREVES